MGSRLWTTRYKVLIQAQEQIILKVGGSTVTIKPDSVIIKSQKIGTDGNTYLGDPDAPEYVEVLKNLADIEGKKVKATPGSPAPPD